MENKWITQGLRDFSKGTFENGGDNLYVNARGIIETIHRTDMNNDGYVDIILPNSHGYIERGPTWIYTQSKSDAKHWIRSELENDSGWLSRVADVDSDGYPDLIVVNGENGVSSELDSYIYWGGPEGLTGERTVFHTSGAYDAAVVDINGDGRLDIIFTSAWVDHHNPGLPRNQHVFIQKENRMFIDKTESYGLKGIACTSLICEDLTGNGFPDLVLANYRDIYEYNTNSFLYLGGENGFDRQNPMYLPTSYAMQVIAGDLNGDGFKEIVFCGGNQVKIYWNDHGRFSENNYTIVETEGISTMFYVGAVHADITDVDCDGKNELILATKQGVEIRRADNLNKVQCLLSIENAVWVHACDLNGNGWPDIIVSKYKDDITYETLSPVFLNGPCGFSEKNTIWFETEGAVGCTAGDIGSDGIPQVIYNNTMKGYAQSYSEFPLYAYLGGEDNHYGIERRLSFPTGGGSHSYILADLDLDGYADLAISTFEGVRIFPGGPLGPQPEKYYDLPRGIGLTASSYVLVADTNHNGWLDIIIGGGTYDDKPETMASSTYIFYGGSNGYSADKCSVIPTYCSGMAIHLADVNNDGWLEFIYPDQRGYIVIYPGGPQGFSLDNAIKIPVDGDILKEANAINSADLNGNGWTDLIISIMGHYTRQSSGFYIFYGGPGGYSKERSQFHETFASNVRVSVDDLNHDGFLDLLVPYYSTQFERTLPAHIYRGDGKKFDFENPIVIQCEASCGFFSVDITGNGYRDVLIVCHRNNIGHQVDSLLFFNGPKGLDIKNPTRLPGLGPHGTTTRDFGNAKTRKPEESYISAVYEMKNMKPSHMEWDAETPGKTLLKFQLRWSVSEEGINTAPWMGPNGPDSYYAISGELIACVEKTASWFQYKAIFSSPNGCFSPKLKSVCLTFKKM
jgi:hypothetical protein